MAGLSRSAPVRSTSKQKDNTLCFDHRSSLQSPTRVPGSVPGGKPYSSHPAPMFLSEAGDLGKDAASAPGRSPAWGRVFPPRGLPLVRGTEPPRNGHGWGFVSLRHLGHGFLRNKSKTFPRVPEKQQWRALASEQPGAPGKGQHRTPQKTDPKSSPRLERQDAQTPDAGAFAVGLGSALGEGARERAFGGAPNCDAGGHSSRLPLARAGDPT